MPDPTIEALEREQSGIRENPSTSPSPFNFPELLGPHPFKESEFPNGAGKCDICAGLEEAAIHHYVDPQTRIAIALERLVDVINDDRGAPAYGFVVCESLRGFEPDGLVMTQSFDGGIELAHQKKDETGKDYSVFPIRIVR